MERDVLRLIVGLGNPGPAYKKTRHNIGFMVLDRLASSWHFSFKRDRDAEIARASSGKMLLKPMNYMNLSGRSVGEVARYYKILPEQILVILDDSALPVGALRIRKKGSAGGHNGLASVLNNLSTEVVPRLRIGIGAPNHSMSDYVLSAFSEDESPVMEAAIERACKAVDVISSVGIETAMNRFN